jgi:hypothetical protein
MTRPMLHAPVMRNSFRTLGAPSIDGDAPTPPSLAVSHRRVSAHPTVTVAR